jgi:hypothetical protein
VATSIYSGRDVVGYKRESKQEKTILIYHKSDVGNTETDNSCNNRSLSSFVLSRFSFSK